MTERRMARRTRTHVDREGNLLAAIMGSTNVWRVYISGTEFMVQPWPVEEHETSPGTSTPTMFLSGDNILIVWLDAMAYAIGKARDELNEDLGLGQLHWLPNSPGSEKGTSTTTPYEE